MQNRNNDKYLMIKAKGGMGNRMLCVSTGLIYGELTGRKIIVDWSDGSYSQNGSNVFSEFFSCPDVVSETEIPEENTALPSIWTNNLDKSMADMISKYDPDKHSSIWIHRKYSVDVRRLDYDEDILVFWYYTQRMRSLRRHMQNGKSQFSGLSDAEIIRKVLLERMPVSDKVQSRIDDFKTRNWRKPVIGVHIRHTDLKSNLAMFENHLNKFLEREPDAQVFLATDNKKVNEDFRKKFKNVITTQKWFPNGGSPMHQNPDCVDKINNGIDALVDMYLLADCDYLIYGGASTFSWISQLLSNVSSDRVVDVDRFNFKLHLKRLIREIVT